MGTRTRFLKHAVLHDYRLAIQRISVIISTQTEINEHSIFLYSPTETGLQDTLTFVVNILTTRVFVSHFYRFLKDKVLWSENIQL